MRGFIIMLLLMMGSFTLCRWAVPSALEDKSTFVKYFGTIFKEALGEFGESDVDDVYFYVRVTIF